MKKNYTPREQKLVDILFQVAQMIATDKRLKKYTREEICAWTANQLSACGFQNVPRGASWGRLVEDDSEIEEV